MTIPAIRQAKLARCGEATREMAEADLVGGSCMQALMKRSGLGVTSSN